MTSLPTSGAGAIGVSQLPPGPQVDGFAAGAKGDHGQQPIAMSGFDERAADWDADPAKVERSHHVARCISSSVPLAASMRMLEYGAGTGLVTQALRTHVGRVTLADTSRGMREVIQAKIDTGALTDARAWDIDLSTQPAPDEHFDLIVTVLVLHHIEDLAPVLDAFSQLLDTDGYLCIVDLEHEDGSFHGEDFTGHQGFRREELTDALRTAGFVSVSFTPCHEMVRDSVTYPVFLATCRLRP